jgi:hypothetical protein
MKLTRTIIILGLLISVSSQKLSASGSDSKDTLQNDPRNKVELQFRSLQVDAIVFVFMSGVAGSFDIDILRRIAGGKSSLGLRGGVEQYQSGGPGGATSGSPFIDYNLLLRSTVEGNYFRWDMYVGYMYHTTVDDRIYPSSSLLKYGIEFKWMFVPKICGLLAKASGGRNTGVLGIGFTLGIEP